VSTYGDGGVGRTSESRRASLTPRADRLSAADAAGLRVRLERARADAEAGHHDDAEKTLRKILTRIDRLRTSKQPPTPDTELDGIQASVWCLQAQLSEGSGPPTAEQATSLARAIGVLESVTDSPAVNARAWADYGAALDILGRKGEAEIALREALACGDTSRSTSRRLARILLSSGRPREAEPILRQVAVRDSEDPTSLRLLGDSLWAHGDPEAADVYLAAARLLLAADQLQEAVEAARLAVEAAPANFDARLVLGDGVRLLGGNEEALATIESALKLSPNHPQALAAKADLLRITGDHAGALAALDAILDQSPDDPFALGMKGDVLCNAGRYEEALPQLNKALRLAPDDAWNLGTRGQVHHLLNHFIEARADLQSALSITDDMPWIRAELAWVELNSDELDAAFEHATAALEREPTQRLGLFVLATVHERRGDLEAAEGRFQELTLAEPNLGLGWLRRAAVEDTLGHSQAALNSVRKALELDPQDEAAIRLGVELLLRQDQPPEALALLQTFGDGDQTPSWATAARGAALRLAGAPDRSIDTLRNALLAHPDDAGLHLELARTLVVLEDWNDALAEYRVALDPGGTDDVTTRKELAEVEFRLGRFNDAALTLDLDESGSEWAPDVLSRRGEALRLAGKPIEARGCFLRALEQSRAPEHGGVRLEAETGLLFVYLDLGKPAKAREYAQQLLADGGHDAAVLATVALVDAAEDLYDSALERTTTAMTLSPENGWVRLVRGRILNQVGDWAAAVTVLKPLMDAERTASTLKALGWAAENAAIRDVADRVAEGGLLVLNGDARGLLSIARRAYEAAWTQEPGDAFSRRGLADVYSLEDDEDLARDHYRAIIEQLNGRSSLGPDELGLLAWCHSALGENSVAISLYINAVASHTAEGAYLHFDLGVALLASDQPELAMSTYRRGLAALGELNKHRSLTAALVARNDLTSTQLLGRIDPDANTLAVMDLIETRIGSAASSTDARPHARPSA
jgi:tetratricopeptide (TPR) repeat protein